MKKTFLCFTFEGESEEFEKNLGNALEYVSGVTALRVEFTEQKYRYPNSDEEFGKNSEIKKELVPLWLPF